MFFGLYETLALLIQGAYLMHEGLTPTSEKPKISFSCGLDKPVRFSYGFIFIYNLPLACLERQGVLSKISFQDISGSRQKSLCRPARLYVSLAPISLKSGKCQNIRFIIS